MEKNTILTIPWEEYSEEDIHYVLTLLLRGQGYSVQNLHDSDRAGEAGADLIASKDEERLAIAVKIKPQKDDMAQLFELSQRAEPRKIYAYIKTPTSSFRAMMEKEVVKHIEFWDANRLSKEAIDKNLFFASNLIFDVHPINRTFDFHRFFFFQMWNDVRENKKQDFPKMPVKSMRNLWRLKDVAVTLNKVPDFLAPILEEPIKTKDMDLSIHFVNRFKDFLDVMQVNYGNFLDVFISFYNENKILVENAIIEHSARSHWFGLKAFEPKTDLKKAVEEFKESEDINKTLEKFKRVSRGRKEDETVERYYEEIKQNNDVWAAMNRYIKNLGMYGDFLEYVIDSIMMEYFKDETFMYDREEIIHE